MVAPYPDRKTAARLLAQARRSYQERPEGSQNREQQQRGEGFVDGLRHAAWLLNIEDLVDANLDERSK